MIKVLKRKSAVPLQKRLEQILIEMKINNKQVKNKKSKEETIFKGKSTYKGNTIGVWRA